MSILKIWLNVIPSIFNGKLKELNRFRDIAGNAGWLFFDKVLRMGGGFLINIWIIRYLGPEQYGALSYAISYVALFTAIANLGLYGIVVRDLVTYRESANKILGTALILRVIGGLLCLVLSLGILYVIRPHDAQALFMVAIIAASMVFTSFEILDFWFQSKLQSKNAVFANLPGFILISLAKIALIISGATLIDFAWVAFFEVVFSAIGLITAYQLTGGRFCKLEISLEWAKKLLRDSWPLIFGGLMMMVYTRIDQVMIGQMLGDQSVGLYAAAVKIAEFWYFIPLLILNSVLPTVVEARNKGEEAYYNRIQGTLNLMAIISYCFMMPLAFFSKKIMILLYGGTYVDAAGILTVYVLSGMFVFLNHTREYWVAVENIARFSLYSTTIGALTNIGLNYFLIPRYGNLGAAYATLISIIVSGYLINALSYRTRIIFKMQTKSLLLVTVFRRQST